MAKTIVILIVSTLITFAALLVHQQKDGTQSSHNSVDPEPIAQLQGLGGIKKPYFCQQDNTCTYDVNVNSDSYLDKTSCEQECSIPAKDKYSCKITKDSIQNMDTDELKSVYNKFTDDEYKDDSTAEEIIIGSMSMIKSGDCDQCIKNTEGVYTQESCCNACNYKCDPYEGVCVRQTKPTQGDPTGFYPTIAACSSSCKKYKFFCNGDGKCYQREENGIGVGFDSKEECENQCKFKCDNGNDATCNVAGDCSEDPANKINCFDSQDECSQRCRRTWKCGSGVRNCVEVFDGTGVYNSKSDCEQAETDDAGTICPTCNSAADCNYRGACTAGVCNCAIKYNDKDYVEWSGPYCDVALNKSEEDPKCPVGRYIVDDEAYPGNYRCQKCRINNDPRMVQTHKCSGLGKTDTNKFAYKSYICGTSNNCLPSPTDYNANFIPDKISELGLDKDIDDLHKCGEIAFGSDKLMYSFDYPQKYNRNWPFSDQYISKCTYTKPPIIVPTQASSDLYHAKIY